MTAYISIRDLLINVTLFRKILLLGGEIFPRGQLATPLIGVCLRLHSCPILRMMRQNFMTPSSLFPYYALLCCTLGLVSCDNKRPEAKVKARPDETPVTKEVNRLALVNSPFLKSHDSDPVDWYPWGEEAFKRAVSENKPVMVCIGYSSCPWTLKMQRETYSDPKIAGYLNRHFINVLVDREERPDLNNTFMRHAFLRSNKSGWPLHVWLTPKGLPWHTAVYLPPLSKDGLTSFKTTIEHVVNDWQDPVYVNREAAFRLDGNKDQKAAQTVDGPRALNDRLGYRQQLVRMQLGDGNSKLDGLAFDLAYDKFNAAYDPAHGGFSGAPKFHQASVIEWLMEYASFKKRSAYGRSDRARLMAINSLEKLATGALQDQLGGGFHRYCIDPAWTVPQFEKMLFDQGYLAQAFLRAGMLTLKPEFMEVARNTLEYVEAELSNPAGGFYCAENCFSSLADGEQEGAYYLWTKSEIDKLVGPEIAPVLGQRYALADSGNLPVELMNVQTQRFPGQNILRQDKSLEEVAKALGLPLEKVSAMAAEGRAKLLAARRIRPRPLRDEKVLPAWNAVMISAFLQGSTQLNEPNYLKRAVKAAEFTYTSFIHANYTRPRFAEDYALLIKAVLDFYETTGEAIWLERAVTLQGRMDKELWDTAGGGYWDGPTDPNLFIAMKSCDEASEFAPNATAAANLVRLARLLGDQSYLQRAGSTLNAFAGEATASPPKGVTTPSGPATHVRMLGAYDLYSRPGCQFLLCGKLSDPVIQAMQAALLRHYRPNSYVLYLDGGPSEALLKAANKELAALKPEGEKPVLVVARNFKQEMVITTPAELKTFLAEEF
jgi:uncharacterized protein YyaL (SSP411 family)